MRYFDLHCDTLYKVCTDNKTLNSDECEVSVTKASAFSDWIQCMAIWLPDDMDASSQMNLLHNAHNRLMSESKIYDIPVVFDSSVFVKQNKSFIFTVENCGFLDGNINNIQFLRDLNVRMATLTWNAENCIGGGADAQHKGITPFGAECVKEFEDSSIIVDVSHASDKLFYDVAEIASKPFVASHSNSRKICPHRRNLTDDQFEIIRKNGGLVGLNFHRDFLSVEPHKASVKDVLLHIEHFLSLGGEDTLAIGSDYDGSNIPSDLDSIEKVMDLYEEFLRIGYNEQLVQKIMFLNAHNFFSIF